MGVFFDHIHEQSRRSIKIQEITELNYLVELIKSAAMVGSQSVDYPIVFESNKKWLKNEGFTLIGSKIYWMKK